MITMADFYKNKGRLTLGIGLLCVVVLGSVLLTSGLTNGDSADDSSQVTNQYNAETLLKYKTPYVGNNSKVVNLLSYLPYAEWRGVVSLQTGHTPYGITVNYDFSSINLDTSQIESTFRQNAAIIFALIDNADIITFRVSEVNGPSQPHTQYQYTRTEIQQSFNQDLREYSQDVQTFKKLLDVF